MKFKAICPLLLFATSSLCAQFGPQQIISTKYDAPTQTIPFDVDNDGFLDLLVYDWDASKLVWFENLDGEGSFGPEQLITNTILTIESLKLADIDNDGDLDIVYKTLYLDKLGWLENLDGTGDFGPEQIIFEGSYIYSFEVADITSDGYPDILAVIFNSGLSISIAWIENLGAGTSFASPFIIESVNNDSTTILLTDVDSDKDIDILTSITSGGPSVIVWYENLDGVGSYGTYQFIYQYDFFASDLTRVSHMLRADIDNDGADDILLNSTHEDAGNRISWMKKLDEEGNFGNPQNIYSYFDIYLSDLHAADVDLDDDLDVLFTFFNQNEVAWIPNLEGTGVFGENHIITTEANGIRAMEIGHFNSDGLIDVVTGSVSDDTVAWYENLGVLNVEESALTTTTVYPNPSSGIVQINSSFPIIKLTVFSLLGEQLRQVNNSKSIDLSNLPTGIYLLTIAHDRGTLVTKRIVID